MRNYYPLQPPIFEKSLGNPNYQYQEYLPSKLLSDYVVCYWSVHYHPLDTYPLHRIVPDGCIDIIFDLQSTSLAKGSFAVGLMTTFETMKLRQKQNLLGIRFYADTARRFIMYPPAELMDTQVLLVDIWGQEASLLQEDLLLSKNLPEKINKIEMKLVKLLSKNTHRTDLLLETSMQYLFTNLGIFPIRTLAEKTHFSERTIRRVFKKELGVSPKAFSNIIRFQSSLKELHDNPSSLSNIAANYGYYDQSHYIHQFKRHYGQSPKQILLK